MAGREVVCPEWRKTWARKAAVAVIGVLAVNDSRRLIAGVHDSQLTGSPIHYPSAAVRVGLERAHY